jgi:hypothetical protein
MGRSAYDNGCAASTESEKDEAGKLLLEVGIYKRLHRLHAGAPRRVIKQSESGHCHGRIMARFYSSRR